MLNSLHPLFYDSGAPRMELADDVDFPVGTNAIIVDDVARVFVKQDGELWKGGNVLDSNADDTLATKEIPNEAVLEVGVASHSDVFSLLRYSKEDGGRWKLLNAELLGDTDLILVVPQDVYKPEQDLLLVVNYHATSLSRILADHEVVRHSHLPAFTVDVIENERRSIRYCFPRCPLPTSQPRIRTEMSRTPNTRGQLALTIAKDLRGKLAAAKEETLAPFGQPLNFDDLVLLSADFRGPGTIQARIGVIRPVDNDLE
ncbi:hypothetical protein ONZ51_g13480 [Trametes cubensis]|uniref:Uncharacterized protein n=1 Tax=Trametes cubensis TaxID=1111947 RepID=A0AAD7TGG8_9APHY|nr:hypothetical protein ONZ51_g13480 [Trametes cubensis]